MSHRNRVRVQIAPNKDGLVTPNDIKIVAIDVKRGTEVSLEGLCKRMALVADGDNRQAVLLQLELYDPHLDVELPAEMVETSILKKDMNAEQDLAEMRGTLSTLRSRAESAEKSCKDMTAALAKRDDEIAKLRADLETATAPAKFTATPGETAVVPLPESITVTAIKDAQPRGKKKD